MAPIEIDIAKEFTNAPGARFITDGPYSGEEFYNKLLFPRFEAARKSNTRLIIRLDNVWGYPSSFVSGSFGKLTEKYSSEVILSVIEFDSKNEMLIRKLEYMINNPNKRAVAV